MENVLLDEKKKNLKIIGALSFHASLGLLLAYDNLVALHFVVRFYVSPVSI